MSSTDLAALEPLVGTWQMVATFEGMPPTEGDAPCTFEWMTGGQFLLQRWSAPDPAPSGLAIIGADPVRAGGFLQHYFDSRGVARVYRLSLRDGILELTRDEADFSPLDFAQRYTGSFSLDGRVIQGQWEIRHPGKEWERDFGFDYHRIG
jgi:hypothetical protein